VPTTVLPSAETPNASPASVDPGNCGSGRNQAPKTPRPQTQITPTAKSCQTLLHIIHIIPAKTFPPPPLHRTYNRAPPATPPRPLTLLCENLRHLRIIKNPTLAQKLVLTQHVKLSIL
jgi:hypothetical protein